jgi:NACHT domain-containing protein
VTDIRIKLETTLVRPIFDSVRPDSRRDHSLPEVVVSNRRSRAYERVLDALDSRGASTIPEGMRIQLESMIEAWSTQSFDDAFQPIQEFEIRCARERERVMAELSGDSQRVLEVLESEYRRKVAERFGTVELRGIQLNHRVILDVDQVYVPLHFEELTAPDGLTPSQKDRPDQITLFEVPSRMSLAEIVKESGQILLIGSPGSGKSTLLSLLASRCAVGNHGLSWPDRALPFVVTVRELKDADLTPAWLAARLEVEPDLISTALRENRAVLLIDGLDEAP